MGPAEGWGGRASPCGRQLQQGRLLGGRLSPLASVPTPGGRQNGTESLDTQAALDTPGVRGCVIRTSATAAHKRCEGRKCRTRSTGEDTGSIRSCSQEGPLTGVIQPKAGPGDARERGGPAQTMSANAPQQSSCPVARSCPTLRNGPYAAHRASLSATVSQTLLVFLGPVRPAISSSIAPFS